MNKIKQLIRNIKFLCNNDLSKPTTTISGPIGLMASGEKLKKLLDQSRDKWLKPNEKRIEL
jgi:hypothetical protein